mmetsp:Transcript_55891/g.118864  ORF Transcript_55891/g.118864 Transcript_55891/m.118864 type:complete len:305 (-) Transcript_55891:316-1230(-)
MPLQSHTMQLGITNRSACSGSRRRIAAASSSPIAAPSHSGKGDRQPDPASAGDASRDFADHPLGGLALKPDRPGTRQRRQEEALAPEEHVLKPGHGLNVEIHPLLKCHETPAGNSEDLSLPQVLANQRPPRLDHDVAGAGESLQHEPLAAEESAAEVLREFHVDVHRVAGAQEGPLLADDLPPVFLQREPHDFGREVGAERDVAVGPVRSIVGVIRNEDVLSREHPLEASGESSSGGGVHGYAICHVHHGARFGPEDLVRLQAYGDDLAFLALDGTGGVEIDREPHHAVGAREGIPARLHGRVR